MPRNHNDGVLTSDQVQKFFLEGFLHLPGILGDIELATVRSAMDEVIRTATPGEDFRFASGHRDGKNVLSRVEYVVDKSASVRAMLAHPLVLSATEQLAGRDFFPTSDAMVLKMPGQGIAVPWHRDLASTDDYPSEVPVFIADYYLDDADRYTCLWVVPGSHLWSDEKTKDVVKTMNDGAFSTVGAKAVLMCAGDVLLHNVRLLHGSPPNESDALRRVIYITMHTAHIEWEHGPYNHEYIKAKQRVLRGCIRERARSPYGATEQQFSYRPPAAWDKGPLGPNEQLVTYRYDREEYKV